MGLKEILEFVKIEHTLFSLPFVFIGAELAGDPAPSERIRLGRAEYDPERGFLTVGGEPMRLTSAEASLLSALSAEPGLVLSRDELTRLCAIDGGERAIDVQVTRLRRKIEPDPRVPQYLQTVRGRGYVLRPD